MTLAAWIAVVATVGGVMAFGWFVSQIPVGTFEVGLAFGVAMTGAMFFLPQALIVFLFAAHSDAARIAGTVLAGLAAIAGIGIALMWLSGAQFEGGASYDLKALGLWLPLVVMGVIDGVAAAITLLAMRHDRGTSRRVPTS